MAVGAVLAVFTAAAVAVIALFAGVLVFLVGLVMRTRRSMTPRRRAGDLDVIAVPYVLKYLVAELAAMGLRMSFAIAP